MRRVHESVDVNFVASSVHCIHHQFCTLHHRSVKTSAWLAEHFRTFHPSLHESITKVTNFAASFVHFIHPQFCILHRSPKTSTCLGNANAISHFNIRRDFFKKSFFPTAFIEWNKQSVASSFKCLNTKRIRFITSSYKTRNQPKPPTTNQNHPQPAKKPAKATHNQPKLA